MSSPDSWYLLKHEDRAIFGPIPFSELKQLADDARVAPLDQISVDRQNWVEAPSIVELQMEYSFPISTGVNYGPTTLGALQEFHAAGEIEISTVITNILTGQTKLLGDMIGIPSPAKRSTVAPPQVPAGVNPTFTLGVVGPSTPPKQAGAKNILHGCGLYIIGIIGCIVVFMVIPVIFPQANQSSPYIMSGTEDHPILLMTYDAIPGGSGNKYEYQSERGRRIADLRERVWKIAKEKPTATTLTVDITTKSPSRTVRDKYGNAQIVALPIIHVQRVIDQASLTELRKYIDLSMTEWKFEDQDELREAVSGY